jgi:hypothetical protein
MGGVVTSTYLAEEGDGLLVQGLRVSNVASNNTLEGKLGALGELL